MPRVRSTKKTKNKEQLYESSIHLKNLKAHVRNSQINFGALSVSCWVEADAVHLQFTGNLEDLKV